MERYEQVKESRRHIFFNNFLGGIAWALGATLGIAVIIALVGILLKNINLVPFIGNFVTEVAKYVLQHNQGLMYGN